MVGFLINYLHVKLHFTGNWTTQFNEEMWMGKSFKLTNYIFPTSGTFTIDFQYKRIFVDIFDPIFYMNSEKVLNVPMTNVRMQPGDHATLNLQVEYIETIRRRENPCEESSDYSFTKCVKVFRTKLIKKKYCEAPTFNGFF